MRTVESVGATLEMQERTFSKREMVPTIVFNIRDAWQILLPKRDVSGEAVFRCCGLQCQ